MSNLEEKYNVPSEWNNYGDVNPEKHGGLFAKWEGEKWHIIRTWDGDCFEHMHMKPQDIWTNGNPYEGFTEKTLNGLESFSNLPFGVLNSSDELPEGESYHDYVNWYMDNHFKNILGNIIHVQTLYIRSYRHDTSQDYWGYLKKFGINQEDF